MARIGYADPPYIGCAHLYADQPEYTGEINHAELMLEHPEITKDEAEALYERHKP